MPSRIVQKHSLVGQDDAALMQTMETLIEHFDRIAAAAARLAEQEHRDGDLVVV